MIESKTSVSVVKCDDKQDNNDGKYGDDSNHINVFGISLHNNDFAHLKVHGVCHDKYGEHDESVDVNNAELVCRNIHLSNDVGKHKYTSSKTSTCKERLKVANTHIVPEVNKRRLTPATPKVSSVVYDVKDVNLCNSKMSDLPPKGIRVSHF